MSDFEWEEYDAPDPEPAALIIGEEFYETLHFKRSCAAFGIDAEEGKRRHQAILGHNNDPDDPICIGCGRRPEDLGEYIDAAHFAEVTPIEYVINEEGTYNSLNGHFMCSPCYIVNGQPSRRAPDRWICP
jgi:hypothetical protein